MRHRTNPRPMIVEAPVTFPRAVRRILHSADRSSCPTGKVSYRTRCKALRVLETLRSKGGHERAAYLCSVCGAHHLTSQDPSRARRAA